MKTKVAAAILIAIIASQALPTLWSTTASSVCGTQVVRDGSYSASLGWAGMPYWKCRVTENGHTKQINLGWYPMAEPKDKL